MYMFETVNKETLNGQNDQRSEPTQPYGFYHYMTTEAYFAIFSTWFGQRRP